MDKTNRAPSWMEQINKTKLFPPVSMAKQVRRTLVLNKLAQTDAQLILVRAPAGYGKSSAVGQWFGESKGRSKSARGFAWLSIDSLDNNLKRFVYHFVASVNTFSPDFGESILGQLNALGRLSLSALTATIIFSISRIAHSVTLVIDDFHLINNAELIKLITLIAEQQPDNLTLLFISRMSLPFGVSRIKAAGRYLEVDADDLRFSMHEVEEFIFNERKMTLSPDLVSLLTQKTEGWPAGLKFTSLSLKSQVSAEQFITSFSGSNKDIGEYLIEEVLENLPVKTRNFLTKTAVLDRMCPSLCNKLTGRDDAENVLNELKSLGLFVIPLDDENQWCRYHHLFSDFLLKRLRAEKNISIKELYQSASQWFFECDYIDEAIKYALAADDVDGALNILESSCDQMFYDGRLTSLVHWVEEIGDFQLDSRPGILLNYIWVLVIEWRFLYANRLRNRVKKLLDDKEYWTGKRQCREKLSMLLAHRDMMYFQVVDDMSSVIEQANHILEGGNFEDPYLAGNVYTSLIFAEREFLKLDRIREYDSKSAELYNASGSTFVRVWHGSLMAPSLCFSGELSEAKQVLEEAVSCAMKVSGEFSPLVSMPALLKSQLLFEENNIEKASCLLETYLPLSEKIGVVDQLLAGFITKSRIQIEQDNWVEAKLTLQHAEQVAIAYNFSRLYIAVNSELLHLACKEGDRKTAKILMQKIIDRVGETKLTPVKKVRTTLSMAALAHCRLLRTCGNYEESIQLSRSWMRFCYARKCFMQYLLFGMCLVSTCQLQGDNRRAIRLLKDLLQEPGCFEFINSFVAEGAISIKLLIDIAKDCVESRVDAAAIEHARRILERRKVNVETALDQPDVIANSHDSGINVNAEVMGKQELTVLILVSEGNSNKEIASRLALTEGTVKWILQSVYDKLGVRRRGKAVLIAKELGIIA